jgi:hypothetical protein
MIIKFTVNTETKTICFGESDSLEEMQYIINMFPEYTVTNYLAFDELNKSIS